MDALADHDVASLEARLREWGCKPSHAPRVLRAFYNTAGRPDWSSLPVGNELRRRLESDLSGRRGNLLARTRAADGTEKLLIGFAGASGFPGGSGAGGGAVESVLMPGFRPGRAAGCVSSQIGCAMGCDFCASTRNGLERNLAAGEIVEQFLYLREAAAAGGRKLTSLVFMGMGEPMHNLDNVLPAVRRIADPAVGGLGWRQVTVSTVGIVPGIDRLAAADLNVHLALSLHAPDDATRAKLVPVNRRYPVAEILDAVKRFHEKTGRIVTIEYCLLAGVNDSDGHARALAGLLRGFRTHVNLIPYNATGPGVSGAAYARPPAGRVREFLATLRAAGTVAHVRDTRGDDVNAACGQLRETFMTAGAGKNGETGTLNP